MTGGVEAPAAVLAVLAAVAEANPSVPPGRLAELQVRELAVQGWHVGPPGSCRPTNPAAGAEPVGRRLGIDP